MQSVVRVAVPVRILPVLTILLLAVASAMAQTQERKLMDRMLKPDLQRGNCFQGRAYNGGGGSMSIRTSSAADRTFAGTKGANIKDFAFTRSFLGLKNPWFGNRVCETKDASTWSRSVVMNANKAVDVRKAEAVGSYYNSGKEARFGSPVVPVRQFIPAPASPGAVSQITDKIKTNMTIDEIRDLLNKPR